MPAASYWAGPVLSILILRTASWSLPSPLRSRAPNLFIWSSVPGNGCPARRVSFVTGSSLKPLDLGRSVARFSRLPLRRRLTGCLELLPVGRVFECLIELHNRLFRFPPIRQRVAPTLERIGEVRALLMGGFELCDRAVDVAFREPHLAPLGKGEGE